MSNDRKLTMKLAGRFIDLLGHQMYGGPVPVVAEMISNAWDADSEKVEIELPEDPCAQGACIVVKDYGVGMTFEEINECYLTIGYERRLKGERTAGNRLVMGRKGIGKLAGFGVAEDITLIAVKGGHLVEFNLNYNELLSKKDLKDFELTPSRDEATSEPNGVTVILKKLKLSKRINIDSFRRSMGRRFAINSEEMGIFINNVQLSNENLSFEYRLPPLVEGEGEEEIPSFGTIKYWFGFLSDTIKDPEMRGVRVFARGRIAQTTPFFFNLSGGINGQVGLEYLTGQIIAEPLDQLADCIATGRQAVNWEFPQAKALEVWGQNKIKELCADWKSRKGKRNLDKFKHSYEEFDSRLASLFPQERKDLEAALERIASIERINEEDFRVIAHSMILGIERESVKKVIRKINTVDESALPELFNAIREWDIIAAVTTAEMVSGQIEIIKKFKLFIENKVPEKASGDLPDMQTFVKEHPWLLGQEYEHLVEADFHHERGVDKWIEDILININSKEYSSEDGREGRRFDLLVTKNDWQVVILELMRPGEKADYDHLMRLNRYVTRIQAAIEEKTTNPMFKNRTVQGVLIADDFASDSSLQKTINSLPNIQADTWGSLLERVQSRYRDFLDLLREKTPYTAKVQDFVKAVEG